MAVAAMGRGDVVALVQRRAGAGRDAFLPEIGVEVAAAQPLPVELDALRLELPDRIGGAEDLFQDLP